MAGTQYWGVARLQKPQTQAVSGATATFTNPIGAGVYKFYLGATVDICYVQGTAPLTATTSSNVIFASEPMFVSCYPGESVAVIARDGASTGTAYLSEAV